MSNICGLDRVLKAECNLQHFTRNCSIRNFDDFERYEADAYLQRAGLLNVKEKGMTICYIMKGFLVMFLKGGKVNVVQHWWNIVAKLKVKWSHSKWFFTDSKFEYCCEYYPEILLQVSLEKESKIDGRGHEIFQVYGLLSYEFFLKKICKTLWPHLLHT